MAQAIEVQVQVTRLGDSTHLEFNGSATWNYDINKVEVEGKTKMVMTLPDLTSDTVNTLKTWKDPLINDISVKEGGVDGSYIITFELAQADVKAFDYLTEEPSRLIVDFYTEDEVPQPVVPKEEKETVKKAVKPKKILPAKKVVQAKKPNKKKVQRQPAGTDYIQVKGETKKPLSEELSLNEQFKFGIYDGGDPQNLRFRIKDYEINENAVAQSRQNIFLHFPMLDLGIPTLGLLQKKPPIYEILPKETEENKISRLLLVLYKGRKTAMFNKTLKYFRNKYPKSEYDELVGYMEADLHYFQWQLDASPIEFASAMAKYRVLVEKFPESPLIERTLLLLSYSYLKKNDLFGALKTFQRFLRLKPKSDFKDQVRLAVGRTLLKMNRFADALDTYRRVSRNGDKRRFRVKAKYLMGDVFFAKSDYKNAIEAYKQALKAYPNDWHEYPNVFFNMAESMFWTEEYKKSMDTFVEFLKRHPSNEYGGYAMTRLGELLEIFGAEEKKVRGAFLESYFRYRSSQGGDLARVRILSGEMKTMKKKEITKALDELNQIVQRSELNKMDQFVEMRIADGFHDRGEFERAIDILTRFFQKNPTKINREVFTARIIRNIASKIRKLTDQGLFLESMKFHSKYQDSWLKNHDRLDIIFDQGRSFELAGVNKEAARLYRKSLNRLYSIQGTPKAKDRSSFEKTPSADELNLRLAAVNLRMKKISESNNFLREIKDPRGLTYQQQVELVEIASHIAESRGEKRLAVSFLRKLTDTWKGQPELVSGPYIRLAELQMQSRQYRGAESTLKKVLNLVVDTKKVSEEHHFKALQLLGQVHEKRGRWNQAMTAYKELLQNFESKRDLQSVRYRLGELYFKKKNIKMAEQAWKSLIEQGEGLWADLAKERLESVGWGRNYSKYINRIPAMKDFEKKD